MGGLAYLTAACVVVVAVFLGGDCDLVLRGLALRGLPDDAFAGRSVWVVGASTGIGAACVHFCWFARCV